MNFCEIIKYLNRCFKRVLQTKVSIMIYGKIKLAIKMILITRRFESGSRNQRSEQFCYLLLIAKNMSRDGAVW